MNPMLTVIGSGTLVPSPGRASPCHLLEAGNTRLLLDAGPGSVHGMARHGKPWWKITHLVFSHYHTDHFGDLPHLLFAFKRALPAPRSRPLRILGPPGLGARVEALRVAYGGFMVDPGFELTYHEVSCRGSWTDEAASMNIRFVPTRHTRSSVAVRTRLGSGSAGYTGDTGPEPALGAFFKGVDVLVSECGYADPPKADNHLSPTSVAALARTARPGLLILTHLYPPLDPESTPALVREAGYGGTVICAEDGQEFEVRGGKAGSQETQRVTAGRRRCSS